jgi:hypothetical protein
MTGVGNPGGVLTSNYIHRISILLSSPVLSTVQFSGQELAKGGPTDAFTE